MTAWITKGEEPELVKATVQGKPGFKVLPQGEDNDEIIFTSLEALFEWTQRLMAKVQYAEHAQPYEEWLEEVG